MFWHYLEKSPITPTVTEENLPICYGLHVDTKSVLYRVSYYKKRINLEVSHIVSDGRGTLNFFKTLFCEYLKLRYSIAANYTGYQGTSQQMAEDSYNKYYQRGKGAGSDSQKVYRLAGWRDQADPTFIEYHLPASRVLELARSYSVSVTALVIAAVICAIREGMPHRERYRVIRMDVPADLRQIFGSNTTRNFFGLAYITYLPEKDESLEAVAIDIQAQLKIVTQADNLKPRMMRMIGFEKSPWLRFAPLLLKDFVLDMANRLAARKTTTTVSNLGVIDVDPHYSQLIDGLTVLTSTSGLNFSLCTFKDDLTIGISTVFSSLEVVRQLYQVFDQAGIDGCFNVNKEKVDLVGNATSIPASRTASTPAGSVTSTPAGSVTAGRRAPIVDTTVFPENQTKTSGTVALNILGFVSGLCVLLMLLLWQLVPLPGDIVFTVCVALIINYLFIRNIIIRNPDFLRVVVRYFLVLLALAAVWFLFTANLAITTFVIPGICLVAIIFDAALIAIFSSTFIVGYAKYLLFDIALGLAPLLLVVAGLTTWSALAYISAFTASIFFLGLLVFMRKHLVAEIRKLFSL
jgi:NRPS condensation-like uncharacterized protein